MRQASVESATDSVELRGSSSLPRNLTINSSGNGYGLRGFENDDRREYISSKIRSSYCEWGGVVGREGSSAVPSYDPL